MKLAVPGLRAKDENAANQLALVAAETLLGEEMLDKWVGVIEACPLEARRGIFRRKANAELNGAVPIAEMAASFDRIRNQIRDELPNDTYQNFLDDSGWSAVELPRPAPAPDHSNQDDLFVATTANVDLWKATRTQSFYDERFSRCDETFCYLKLDGSKTPDAELFSDRSEIESALDAALKPHELGCVIGGGTGLRYSYIELALTDLRQGIQIIRDRLCAGHVPRQSWLMFHNAALRSEWVGMYADSPAPLLKS